MKNYAVTKESLRRKKKVDNNSIFLMTAMLSFILFITSALFVIFTVSLLFIFPASCVVIGIACLVLFFINGGLNGKK